MNICVGGVVTFNLCGTYPHVLSDIEFLVHNKVLLSIPGEYGNVLFKQPIRTLSWNDGDGCTATQEMRSLYNNCHKVK